MMLKIRQLLPKAVNAGGLVAAADEPLPLAVLEFQSPTAAVIAKPLPAIARSSTMLITALMVILIVIASTMKMDQLVAGNAIMSSTSPDIAVQAFNSSSILRSVTVHAGQFVHKGDIVATLDPTYAKADLTGLTQQEQNYAAQVAQLEAQEAGKPYIPDPNNPYGPLQLQTYQEQMGQYNFTMQNYAQQINQLQTQINGYNSQAGTFSQRLGLAEHVLAMRQKLQKLQVGSELDTESASDQVKSMQGEVDSNLSSAAAAEKQLASVTAQMNSFSQQFKAQASTQLATALNSLSQAQQALTKANLNSQEVDLTAPQDSVVDSVAQTALGSVLQPGQTLLTLSPVNAPFTIEAQINASESGFVHIGNKVDLEFQTLPQTIYGSATGTVLSISANSFNPQDQQSNQTMGQPLPGSSPQSLYYKAEISLDELNLHNVPTGFQLTPGMPVDAYVIVGHQTFMQWLFSQYASVVSNAFHEP